MDPSGPTRTYKACMNLGGPVSAYEDPQGPIRVEEEYMELDGHTRKTYKDL